MTAEAAAATPQPTTRVTRLPQRPRPAPKTPFAKHLTTLLATPHGLAAAIVLQEILGPPKCRRMSATPPPPGG